MSLVQNLTTTESNVSDSLCTLCVESSIYVPAILLYILLSLPTNGFVLWLMISSPLFGTERMEVLELHLVITEIMIVFVEILILSANFISNVNHNMMNLMIRFAETIIIARNQFQTCVCIERYLAVSHPVLYLRFKPLRYRMSFCCVIWLQVIFLTVLKMDLCSSFSISIHIIYFMYDFSISSLCCLSALRVLKQPSPGEGEKEGSIVIEKRAFNIVLLFQVTTFLSYVPLITVFLLHDKIDSIQLCIWYPLTYCLMIWFGAIYPVFYLRKVRNTK